MRHQVVFEFHATPSPQTTFAAEIVREHQYQRNASQMTHELLSSTDMRPKLRQLNVWALLMAGAAGIMSLLYYPERHGAAHVQPSDPRPTRAELEACIDPDTKRAALPALLAKFPYLKPSLPSA